MSITFCEKKEKEFELGTLLVFRVINYKISLIPANCKYFSN